MKHTLFKNPPADYYGKPFWAWNGELEDEELRRQIAAFSDMGMGGYFCHSRTGLETDYLGEEWFDKIRLCAEEGAAKGMETWLYDEDRWPSGTCGGQVCENPAYRLHYLRLEILPAADWQAETLSTAIAAFSADVYGEDGLSFSGKQRLHAGDTPAGSHVLLFTAEEMAKDSFYNDYTYVDTMNPDAVQEYIHQTHEAYKSHVGAHFGGSIRGIFTDEPHRGAIMCGFSVANRDPYFLTPFPRDLFELFAAKYGHDLQELLPELFLKENGCLVHPVKWEYMELLQELFLDNYLKPIQRWCQESHLQLTGHLLHEDNLSAQTAMIGSIMRGYPHMDIPGIDTLFRHNPSLFIAKQIQSVARQCQKPWILSEMYAGIGWDAPFLVHKAIGDWQALFGINVRCHHLSLYTMKGEAKRDYPPSIHLQSAWHPHYRYVENYFARIGWFMQNGTPLCDLLVLSPVESMWAQIHPGWCNGGFQACPALTPIEQRYADTFRYLCARQIDFDYGDEALLSEMGAVVRDGDTAYLQVGAARYRRVLLTGMTTVRTSTLRLLTAFREQGGEVILWGDAPDYVDALPRKEEIPFTVALPFGADEFPAPAHLTVTDAATGEPLSCIYSQIRRDEDALWILLMNIDRDRVLDADIRLPQEGWLEQWDARDGSVHLLNASPTASLRHRFHESGELLLRLSAAPSDAPLLPQSSENAPSRALTGPFAYTLHEPNVCVLDMASWQMDDGETQPVTEILRIDRQIRQDLGLTLRGGTMVQPWFRKRTAPTAAASYGRVTLEFAFEATRIPSALALAIECPQLWDIQINGTTATQPSNERWVDACFSVLTVDTSALRLGHNRITLSGEYTEDLPLEALYLLGDFGVQLHGSHATLTPLPAQLAVGDITTQGFPFYGGELTYQVPMPSVASGAQRLELEAFGAACVYAEDGDSRKYLAFPPYTCVLETNQPTLSVTYSLTRRNTFGPLHACGLFRNGCAPDSFVTAGAQFDPTYYDLIPAGMTHPLRLASFE